MRTGRTWSSIAAFVLTAAAIFGDATGTARAQCMGVDTGDVSLVSEAGIGNAKARFVRKEDCDRDLRVEAQDVPLGYYDLCVDGVFFGAFQVVKVARQTEGDIDLDSHPDHPGERLYTAAWPDALGASIEVRQSTRQPAKNRKQPSAGGTPCTGTLFFSYTSFPDEP